MFDAPVILKQIPDIDKIYEINEGQITELTGDVDQINDDLFVDTMSDDALKHWEKIYGLTVYNDESLNDRRVKVKGKMLEKLPYSYRVILRNLDTLLPNGYEFAIDQDLLSVTVKVNLTDKYLIANVTQLMEDTVPLNMLLTVELLYNTYAVLGLHTHAELASYTYQGLNDEPIANN